MCTKESARRFDVLGYVILSLAGASAANAQCYEFFGSGVSLKINITAINFQTGPAGAGGGMQTSYVFSGTNSFTLGGVTLNSTSNITGAAVVEYIGGVIDVTSFSISVPNADAPGPFEHTWTAYLAGTGNIIPNFLLPPVLPPITAWTGVTNGNEIRVASGKTRTTYPITSVGSCTSGGGGPGPPGSPPARTIAHIAKGGGWRTTVILVNTDTQPANFDLKFWDDNGNPLVLDLGADGITAELSGIIQPGVARFIRTAATGNLQQGWAELTAPGSVDGNAIFGLESPGQGDSEAAVPLSANSGADLFLPFDYSTGYSTAFALANPSQQAVISASILDTFGAPVPAANVIPVPARGHHADALARPFPAVVQKRGAVHFSGNTSIFGLGIRANGKAFTSIEALSGVTSAPKTIAHIADGGGWRMTFLLVNTGGQAANFTLKFTSDAGSPLALPLGPDGTTSSLSGAIPAGSLRIVQTAGATQQLTTGWALLSVTGAIGGTAIFALQTPGQSDSEAAVPFSTAGSTQLFMPYDFTTGYSTGIALTNTNPAAAVVHASFLNDGNHLVGVGQIAVPANGHASVVLSGVQPGIVGTRGTVSLMSNVPVFGLGIRADGTAFTSLKVIAK